MEILGALVALGPVILLVVLLLLRLREMWSRDCNQGLWDIRGPGPGTTGVRELRRPLAPAGSAGAVVEPDVEELVDDVAAVAVLSRQTGGHDRGLRAS